ncbi:general secretion pathway protein GspL [Xylophilus rhododendri]|uniref:General secretion pathway protein GspL n=1 Tax=Xylophilus rhododendri TaxID=2697032 RepID=A0A857J5M8_9BURK|nr:type II secretion system protein GspL [Xylophilus rhododendri]QHI98301.1 general secretion pathway protein GspL [Xylophilus rhododendri]
MSTLLVSLPLPDAVGAAPGSPEFAYVLTADGVSVLQQSTAPAALLPQPGRAGETVAVVPIRALSWQRVNLPPGLRASTRGNTAPRLRAVLDGLLEEHLLDDPASLHFALAPDAGAGEAAWVAVCNRAWLRAALQTLEAAGHPVARVVPEWAPGSQEPSLHAFGTPEDAWLLAGGLPPGGALALLPLVPTALSMLPLDVAGAPLQAEPAVASLAEAAAGRPAELETAAARWLEASRSRWDLAQFDLANSGRARVAKRAGALMGELLRAPQWRAARWGAGLAVAAQVIGLNAWSWKEQAAVQAQDATVRGVLTQSFPNVRVVVDAPVQMQRELTRLRQASGVASNSGVEALLAAAGAALPPGRSAQALEFNGNELRLVGLQLQGEEAGTTVANLQNQGISARTEGEALLLRSEATP